METKCKYRSHPTINFGVAMVFGNISPFQLLSENRGRPSQLLYNRKIVRKNFSFGKIYIGAYNKDLFTEML